MEVVEDLALARRIKRAGLAPRLAFARNLVNVHWASGALGLARVMTKNVFSALSFSVVSVLIACGGLLVLSVLPFSGLFLPHLRLPALIVLFAVLLQYRALGRQSGISPWNALLMPFGAFLLVFVLLRSMATTLSQGGILWRGTFYPLAELRRNSASLK
jgi:hypothetical protein